MEDFFLKNSKEMSNENLTMRKAALDAMPSGPSQVGQSKDIDVQVKVANPPGVTSSTIRIEFGPDYAPTFLKATALPTDAEFYVHTSGGD